MMAKWVTIAVKKKPSDENRSIAGCKCKEASKYTSGENWNIRNWRSLCNWEQES